MAIPNTPHLFSFLLQDKLAELEVQHSNLQELLGVLREQSRGSSAAAGKLMEWHAKLGEMRMREMKLSRTSERYVAWHE